MPRGFSGYEGTVKAGSGGTVDMNISKWSCSYEVAEVDVSNTSDGGFSNSVAGLKKLSGSFSFPYDTDNPPTGAAALCEPGSTPVLELKAYTGHTLTGTALITKLDFESDVNGAVMCVVAFRNKGQWTLPT